MGASGREMGGMWGGRPFEWRAVCRVEREEGEGRE